MVLRLKGLEQTWASGPNKPISSATCTGAHASHHRKSPFRGACMLACLACPKHGRDGQLTPACAGPLPIRCVLDERRHRRMPAVLSCPSVGTSSPCHSFDAGSGLMWPLIWPIPHVCCTTTYSREGLASLRSVPFVFPSPWFSFVLVVFFTDIFLARSPARCDSDGRALWKTKMVGRKARLFGYQ